MTLQPDDISDLYRWWRSSDLSTSYDHRDHISTWSDQHNNDLVQNTGSKQPIFMTNEANGHPAVHFDRSDESRLASTSSVDLDDPHSVFVVHRPIEFHRQHIARVGALSASSFELEFYAEYRDRSSQLAVQSNSSGSNRSFAVSDHVPTFRDDLHMWGYTLAGDAESDLTLYSDGQSYSIQSQSSVGDMVPNQTDDLVIGGTRISTSGSSGPASYYSADVFDIIIYRRSLATHEVKSLWNWASDRYNINLYPNPKSVHDLEGRFTQQTANTQNGSVEEWTTEGRMSNVALTQQDTSKQPEQVGTGQGFDTVQFDSNESLTSPTGRSFETESDYSIVFLYKTGSNGFQNVVSMFNQTDRVTFGLDERDQLTFGTVSEDGTLYAKTDIMPTISGQFGMIGYTVPEEDDVVVFRDGSIYQNAYDFGSASRRLFMDGISRMTVGDQTSDIDIVELLFYDQRLTSSDIDRLWRYFRLAYLSKQDTSSLGVSASLTSDSLVYTFTGTTSFQANATHTGSAHTIARAGTSLSSSATFTQRTSSVVANRSSNLQSNASTFIQSHKNKVWGRSSLSAQAVSGIQGGTVHAVGSQSQSLSTIGSTIAITRADDPNLEANAHIDRIVRESSMMDTATASITADPTIRVKGSTSIQAVTFFQFIPASAIHNAQTGVSSTSSTSPTSSARRLSDSSIQSDASVTAQAEVT